MGPQINVEYICGEIIKIVTVSFNLINLFGVMLLLVFIITAIRRRLNWIIAVLVAITLLGGMYFVSLNIQYDRGCHNPPPIYKTELIPAWWHK